MDTGLQITTKLGQILFYHVMNTTIDQLARRANDAFKNTAGFVSCQARSTTALEFHFTNATDAERLLVQALSGVFSLDGIEV